MSRLFKLSRIQKSWQVGIMSWIITAMKLESCNAQQDMDTLLHSQKTESSSCGDLMFMDSWELEIKQLDGHPQELRETSLGITSLDWWRSSVVTMQPMPLMNLAILFLGEEDILGTKETQWRSCQERLSWILTTGFLLISLPMKIAQCFTHQLEYFLFLQNVVQLMEEPLFRWLGLALWIPINWE